MTPKRCSKCKKFIPQTRTLCDKCIGPVAAEKLVESLPKFELKL